MQGGEYQCFIARRGGSPTVLEVAFTSLSFGRVLDNTAQASIQIPAVAAGPGANCCEVIEETEPWRDEVLIYRGNEIAFVGPVISLDGQSGALQAQDLFFWMERRFIQDDLHYWGDISDTFRAVFDKALEPDPSPNIDLVTHRTGVNGIRSYKGEEVHRAADLLRELARTALDFTTVGRTVYAGGKEVFSADSQPGTPLLLHDEGVMSANPIKDGSIFATDIAVFAGSGTGQAARSKPLVGRATRQVDRYGLVQTTATELLINDLDSANQNALSRLEAVQPLPVRTHVVFSPEAAFEFNDLIPGRQVDARLTSSASCTGLMDMARLTSVSVSVSPEGEVVEGDLIPMGVIEDA